MFKKIIWDGCGYRGSHGTTHFAKTRIFDLTELTHELINQAAVHA